MFRVKDESGNVVPSLLKDGLGNIIVKNDSEYQKYIKEKQQTEKVNALSDEIAELKQLINKLINSNNALKNH